MVIYTKRATRATKRATPVFPVRVAKINKGLRMSPFFRLNALKNTRMELMEKRVKRATRATPENGCTP